MSTKPKTASLLALFAFIVTFAGRAQILVNGIATPVGSGVFHYEFSVNNTGADDYVVVSLVDAPLGDPLIDPSLVSPLGFVSSYDLGLGFVDFIGDTDSFTPGTHISGFSFDSRAKPSTAFREFEALSALGELVSGRVNYATVPETIPAGWLLAVSVVGAVAVRGRLGCQSGTKPQKRSFSFQPTTIHSSAHP
ncbi:MAG TPA: hypothetical protein PLX89_19065 [Verrucomicrobiota bacterium]|nr:hypothetical protein [Verrucomicrobiales bacterium]HRI15102.1 hypothetical protein [Verrucomicrobiota bacterium]